MVANSQIARLGTNGDKSNVIAWIEKFVAGLVSAFESVKDSLSNRDILPDFANLFVLGRLGPFWPLLLKT